MNPIFDIIAATNPVETQPAGKTAVPAVPGLFSQQLLQALQTPVENIAIPNPGEILASNHTAEGTIENFLQIGVTNQETQAQTDTVDPLLTALLGQVVDVPGSEITSIQQSNTPQSGDIPTARQTAMPITIDPANAIGIQSTTDINADMLKQVVEAQLTQGMPINATRGMVKADIEVAPELQGEDISKIALSIAQNTSEPEIADKSAAITLPTFGRPISATTLKTQLRKEFPTLNVESAVGNIKVAVKSNPIDQVKTETPTQQTIATAANSITGELPAAPAIQITSAPYSRIAGRYAQRRATTKLETDLRSESKNTRTETETSSRSTSRTAVRKPINQALKANEVIFDKPTAETAGAKLNSLNAKNIDFSNRSDSKLEALDSQSARVLDQSNVEKFKVEIKRNHIEALLKRGEVKLQLQPDHLGSLKIKLTTSPNQVSARVETSSEEARRTVELSMPQLKESLERSGFKVQSVEVVVADHHDSQRQHSFHQQTERRSSSQNRFELESSADDSIVPSITSAVPLNGGALNLVA